MTRFRDVTNIATKPPTITRVAYTAEEETAADLIEQTLLAAGIDGERDRRRYAPSLDVTLSVGSIPVNTDATAQANLQGLVSLGMYLASAAPTTTTPFRDFNNAMHDLPPGDLVAMGLQLQQRIGLIYAASWALKATSPIPANYADDSFWP